MPLENPGRTITSVKILKHTVRILVDDHRVDMSHDIYTNHYLFPGKVLTEKEFQELKEAADILKFETYARGLLARGLYTRQQIIDRLYAHNGKRWVVEAVIKHLEDEKLIDDMFYMKERIEYGQARHEGYYHIYDSLKKKGIATELLVTFVYDEDLEDQKAKVWLPRLVKQYSGKSTPSMKREIYLWYFRHGFGQTVITRLLEQLDELDTSVELENLRRDLLTAKRKYGQKYVGYQLKDRLFKYLAQRGYNYSKISMILGVNEDEMD